MRLSFFLLFFCFSFPVYAQDWELCEDARKIKAAYGELMKDARAPLNKMRFVDAFPATKKKFLDVFYPYEKDELYADRKLYIETFIGIGASFPREVLEKSMDIGAELNGSDDIISQLQKTTTELAVRETAFFLKRLKKMKKAAQVSLINFLADVPDYASYPAYQQLIDKLETTGDKSTAAMLVSARELRKTRVHE